MRLTSIAYENNRIVLPLGFPGGVVEVDQHVALVGAPHVCIGALGN